MKSALLYPMMLALACGLAVGQSQYQVLYNFGVTGPNDGSLPNAGFAYHNGEAYGTTQLGGQRLAGTPCSYSGCGAVFALESFYGTPVEAVIYSFCATGDPNTCTDGAYPSAGMIVDEAGNLYGTAQGGGAGMCNDYSLGGCGIAFKLTRSGRTWTETVLYSFNGPDGERPTSQLTFDSNGNLYGTTVSAVLMVQGMFSS